MTYLKSLCKDSVTIIMAMLSHISLLGMIAALNYLTRNLTSANILVTGFLNPLSLLIFGYMRNSWRIEYMTLGPTCKHTVLSFFHMTFELSSLMMVLNRLLPTSPWMILVAMPIAIWSSFLLWFQRVPLLIVSRGPKRPLILAWFWLGRPITAN